MRVEFLVLGDIAVRVDGNPVDVGHPRQRGVLAALLADAGRIVPTAELIDRVWADHPPQHARTALSGYISRLRHVLAPTGVRLHRESGGYRLTADPRTVDLHRFRHLVSKARAESTLELFDQALNLWRGTAFTPMDTPWAAGLRDTLDTERLAAELDHDDLALRLGRTLAPSALAARAAAHPLDERATGQLMLTLYRDGRQAEALHHYERIRHTLADELGTDPGPPLRELHHRILAADPTLAAPTTTPHQLPAPLGPLAGRTAELATLDTTNATIVVVYGTAGVGKTALALTWAHRASPQFPDGQLHADLRGFDTSPATNPAQVVRGFLDALDVPPHRIPTSLDAQLGLYRSLTAGRRMLILLDNARDATQVRPLLPGTPSCFVLVTSRDPLTSLATREHAQPLPLDLLTEAEARELLTLRAGARRVTAEPDAVTELITRCARLPLALSVMAARARFGFATLAAELRTGLDALAGTDPLTDPRSVFSWSYQALGPAAARLFRLFSVHFGPTIGVPAAASLAGLTVTETRPLLAELTAAQLTVAPAPDRYAMHDLLRAYATELAGETESQKATHRLLDHYLHTADAADRQLIPDRLSPIEPAAPGVTVEPPDDPMAWFAEEHTALLIAAQNFPTHAPQLARRLTTYLDRQAHWQDWATIERAAITAAQNPADRAEAHRGLAYAHAELGDFDTAHHELRHALDLYAGDDRGLARTHLAIAWTHNRQSHPTDALAHGTRALELYRAAGERTGQARARNLIGWCRAQVGDPGALDDCEQAVALHRELGDCYGEAASWDSLGYAHHRLGQHAEAVGCYVRAAGLHHAAGERSDEAQVLIHLGDTHAAAGDLDRAAATWQAALALLAELDHPDAERVRTRLATGTR